MIKLHFTGEIGTLQAGIAILAPELGFSCEPDGLRVEVVKHAEPELLVRMDEEGAALFYGKTVHFYRALGLLLEALRSGRDRLEIREQPQFTMNGPMFDVSQSNSVMKVNTVKRFLRIMAVMGLNMIMLYTEDSYDVKEQPYFGYMRSRYSQEEIREMDHYAAQLGIEMIPCIQTLSHLKDVLKWKSFADIRDDEETMLVGEEKTYEFIEQMIVAAYTPVSTKRIHIGMDEAWKLGLGEYLSRNGYRPKFDIMIEHLSRVLEITRKHGLQPMMWSDMFFRAGSKFEDYYDLESCIPPSVLEAVPTDVQQIYWDYYHYDEAFYREWIRRHKKFGSVPVFAGGIWNWRGFVLNYGATFHATNKALEVCKEEGVKEVIATLWGDDGTECDWFSALPGLQLFAEHGYAKEVSEERINQRFGFCTGGRFDDFIATKYVDEVPGISEGNLEGANPSRCLLWQSVLAGLFDRNIAGLPLSEHYAKLEKRMAECVSRNGELGAVFEILRRLCSVLTVKAELGVELTAAYLERNLERLKQLASTTLPDLVHRVHELRDYHRERWYAVNKPFGWEVIDFRYGGLLMGLDTAIKRIGDFLNEAVDRIPELEESRLPFQGKGHGRNPDDQSTPLAGLIDCYLYQYIPTASRLTQP